jgi:hypothetical protein
MDIPNSFESIDGLSSWKGCWEGWNPIHWFNFCLYNYICSARTYDLIGFLFVESHFHGTLTLWMWDGISYIRNGIAEMIWFDLLCLTSISAIFQLYHGDQF